jgi:ADP-ribose pyrophosphatase YjhB (NUDIX family)
VSRDYPERPLLGVVAVVRRGGAFLLVERGREPNRGRWGFPGGLVELGESLFDAALRELAEETSVAAGAPRILTAFDGIEHDDEGRVRRHFAIVAVGLDWEAGEGSAADDAAALGWFGPDELEAIPALPRVPELMRLALAVEPHPAADRGERP